MTSPYILILPVKAPAPCVLLRVCVCVSLALCLDIYIYVYMSFRLSLFSSCAPACCSRLAQFHLTSVTPTLGSGVVPESLYARVHREFRAERILAQA